MERRHRRHREEIAVARGSLAEVLVLVALLTSAFPAQAAITPSQDFVLVGVHVRGAQNSFFRADVTLYNPGPTAASVRVEFHGIVGMGTSPLEPRSISLAAKETGQYEDILVSFLALPLGSEAYGQLRFTSDQPLVATQRVYSSAVFTAGGTVGSFMNAQPTEAALGAGQEADLIGVSDGDSLTAAFRTNILLLEVTGNPASVELTTFDSQGLMLGTPMAWAVSPRGYHQINRVLFGTAGSGTNRRLRLRVTGGTGRVIAFAAVIDNYTNDSFLVEMTQPRPGS